MPAALRAIPAPQPAAIPFDNVDPRFGRPVCLSQAMRPDMCTTCFHSTNMSAMIQIRNVPDALHRRLKSRAALAGMSLSDYQLNEIRAVAERPTLQELRARMASRSSVTPTDAPAQAVRAERDRQ